jgi:cellulose synthase (UDP-forming)
MRNDVENLFPPQPKLSSRKSDQLMTKDIPILPQLVRSKRPLKRKLVKLEPLTSMPQLPLTVTPTPTADMDTVKLPLTPMPQLSLTMRTLAAADMNTVKLPLTPIVSFSDRGVDFAADMNTVKLPLTPLPEVSLAPLLLQHPQTQAQTVGDTPNYSVEQLKVMTPKHEKQYIVLTLIWIIVNIYFWYWWLQKGHIGNPILFGLMTVALLYEMTLLPSFYTFFLGQMRRPKPIDVERAEHAGVIHKVAVISLTVPGSEDLEFVKRQMIAMKNIRYPHDSWILVDKEHSPEIAALARSLGIFYFSRHEIARWGKGKISYWNQLVPPFKAKTKAGNVNSWLDAYGHLYSHFTQLDIDHIPLPSYLNKVLGFFLDPKVKWVQAPSVYGNLNSWTARGSAEQEFVLQGPLQMGFFGFSQTPFIIGSHCTYDMKAIKEIGGFQPTRAEDHLDTVFLAARGYKGVFLPEVIAVGDGPENFETYMAQQFAWAFSMIQVLFTYTAKCIKRYTLHQAVQFLFVQTWYTLWSTCMLLMFGLPIISLFTNTSIARESYWQFLLHILPVTVTALMIWVWSRPWHFPEKVSLSWRGIVLHVVRWPIVLSALIQVLLKVQKPYMITVKGLQRGEQRPFSLASHNPYFALIVISLAACWFYLSVIGNSPVGGYLLFALQGAAIFLLTYIIALAKDVIDMVKEGISLVHGLMLRAKPLLVLVTFLLLIAATAYIASGDIYHAVIFKKMHLP